MDSLITHFNPQKEPWLKDETLRQVLMTLARGGGEARIVGGAVRDALLGESVGDIDLAVNMTPQKVTSLLEAVHIKVIPTGIEHGTVTAVLDHKGYEITTLRQDKETDGRHAKVSFTDDWQIDAARRDFTFNALYVDAEGVIYDYFDGRQDLYAGRVRFIGEARERIKEDVLRILRFFRFNAWFGKGQPDQDALAACQSLASSIPSLSAERVWREIAKLLSADNPLHSWQLMLETGVLQLTLPEADQIDRLKILLEVEKKYSVPGSSLVRLSALLPKSGESAEATAKRLKFSNREAEMIKMLAVLPDHLKGKLDPQPFRHILYFHGAELSKAAAILLATEIKGIDLEPVLEAAAEWEKPQFPLRGEDIMKLGLPSGPKIGEILGKLENWWIDQDFRPSRAECLAKAKEQLKI